MLHWTLEAPNVHQQMCTTRKPFQHLGGLLSNHPNQNQKKTNNYQWESALPKSFCNFFALSEMRQFPRKVQKCNFFADHFRKWENSLGTNIEHMQSRCMAGSAKRLSFLAIFCSAACARLLVHVRCPLIHWTLMRLAHQDRTIVIARDFRVDGAKSPEIPQKEGVLGSEIAARNHKPLAT